MYRHASDVTIFHDLNDSVDCMRLEGVWRL